MFATSRLIFLVVIGLAIGQETRTTPETSSRTLFPTNSTELPISTSLLTTQSETSSRSTASIPISSSTPEPPKTTQVPLTTKPPGPEEGSWNITDGNVTCIRANLAIEFRIGQNYSIFLSPNASSSLSNCNLSNSTQALVLAYENYALTFEFEKDSTSTYVRNVSFFFTSETGINSFYNDTKFFLVKNGNSYLCKSLDSIYLGNATMYIFEIQLEAFGTADETGFSKIEECELDDSVSDVVPIAVACALAGLVVIVLIAYLIGRRRVRQNYTTM